MDRRAVRKSLTDAANRAIAVMSHRTRSVRELLNPAERRARDAAQKTISRLDDVGYGRQRKLTARIQELRDQCSRTLEHALVQVETAGDEAEGRRVALAALKSIERIAGLARAVQNGGRSEE